MEEQYGIRIEKSKASEVIANLKFHKIINNNLKILQVGEFVYIPIISDEVIGDLGEFELVKYQFDPVTQKPQSLKKSLIEMLPSVSEELIPTSFDQIGTLAIIDIKDPMMQFTKEIGEAILNLNPSISSVYRKTSKVHGQYRLRGLELIAGIPKTETIHREHGLEFFVDIELTYFSPRLATEHARIAKLVMDGENVLDLFGGLAPFAFHISSLCSATITTVDINPKTTPLIEKTMTRNRNRLKGKIIIEEGDAKKKAEKYIKDGRTFDRIIMNHPSGSLEYLEFAEKLLVIGGVVYCYVFAPIEDMDNVLTNQVSKKTDKLFIRSIHKVRQSSPSEFHVCLEMKR